MLFRSNNSTTRDAIATFLLDLHLRVEIAFTHRDFNGTHYQRLEHVKILRKNTTPTPDFSRPLKAEYRLFDAHIPKCADVPPLQAAHKYIHDLGKKILQAV